jgi:uncharacterized protein
MNWINPPKKPFSLFIACVMIGILVTLVCTLLIVNPYMSGAGLDPLSLPREKIISMQVINMLGFFIIPPLFFAIFSKHDFAPFFNLNKKINPKNYVYALVLSLVLFPILINIQYLITILPLPASMKILAESQKAVSEQIFNMFLNHPGVGNLFLMILIIGVGAGLTEELFFRGLLMPLIARNSGSYLLAIILSGVTFSLFHANVYDFVPIMIVGFLLGFIYCKTQDLRLNIVLHAVYNSLQVIANYAFFQKWTSYDLDALKHVPWVFWSICLGIACIAVFQISKTKHEHISH